MEVVLDPELVAQSLDVLVCNGRFDPRLEVQEGLSFGALALYARTFFEKSNSDFERRRRVLRCFKTLICLLSAIYFEVSHAYFTSEQR